MSRISKRLAAACAVLLVAATGGLVWAGQHGPVIAEAELSPVWGSVYKLSARVESDRGRITAVEYRAGEEIGPLFASDGLLDSSAERVEGYVDVGLAGDPVAIRAKVGGTWGEWSPLDQPHGGEGPVEGCLFLSTRFGRSDWFRGPVTMDCLTMLEEAGADFIEYSVNFGDWRSAEDALITVDGEGAFWVQVRTVTEDGVAGLPNFFTVAIDQTPPQLAVQAPPVLRLTHADRLSLPFDATDDRSGVAEAAVEINGEHQLAAGRSLELWQLPLGEHEISLFARDRAGNVARSKEPMLLEITVDTESLVGLVQLFGARGKLDMLTPLKRDLLRHLTEAHTAQAAGEEQEAVLHLEAFAEQVQDGMAGGYIFAEAGSVLLADAYALIDQLDEGMGSEPPPWW